MSDSIAPILNSIICGDAIAEMRKMPDASIDLIVTSPPYNLKNSTGNGMKDGRGGKWANAALVNGYATYDDNMPYNEYIQWQRACLAEMLRIIPENGAIFYNHKWRVQAGLIQDRHEIVDGFPVRQIIIWKRKGGINFNPGYFLPTYEVIYLIAGPKFRLVPKANAVGDVWEFMQENKNLHPAPFPEKLIERIISSTSAKIVLDPFSGSGTTAVVAQKLGRSYIGIEISREYCDISERRIAECRRKAKLPENKARSAVKKVFFSLILLFCNLWLLMLTGSNFYCSSAAAANDKATSPVKDEEQWVEMPAGAKPSYMGIHGGTMPVSLLVSDDGSSLLSFVGQTGNDFLEVLRKAYLPFPSFANATRENFYSLVNASKAGKLYAGNATASLPVLSLSASPAISPDWMSHFQPFGLSDEPLSIEGNVSRPEIIPLQKKYRIFFLPDKFFSSKN